MANADIERAVDKMIQSGRVSDSLRNEYIALMENELKDSLLRGADYTNKSKELAQQRREAEQWLQTEKQKIQADRNKLDQWYGGVKNELDEYEKVKKEVLPLMAAYEQTLDDHQILDRVVKPTTATRTNPISPTIPRDPSNPSNPTGGFVTKEHFETVVGNYAALNGKINKIQVQHHELFGKFLDEDLISNYFQTGQDPEEYWRVKYGVDAKKNELEAKNREAYEAKIRAEEREKVMREVTTDPSRVVGAPYNGGPNGGISPLFETYARRQQNQHSQNHANDDAATGGRDQLPLPPEKRPVLQHDRERVNSAIDKFNQHFALDGQPTTEEGRRLFNKHFVTPN